MLSYGCPAVKILARLTALGRLFYADFGQCSLSNRRDGLARSIPRSETAVPLPGPWAHGEAMTQKPKPKTRPPKPPAPHRLSRCPVTREKSQFRAQDDSPSLSS